MLPLVTDDAISPWESSRQLALSLDKISNTLIRNLQRFTELGDTSGVETIWACCIMCLGHLTALSHLISQREPALANSMNDMCDLALDKLGDLSSEVHVEVYSYFDILTRVRTVVVLPRTSKALTEGANQISLKRGLDTIDARLGLCSHAENESLRYLRGVIGKVHADFQANLQGCCGPSWILSGAVLVDGRTADSKYPNLILHSGREPYGL